MENKTAVIDEDTEHQLSQSDANPTFAPDLLQTVLLETAVDDHLQINHAELELGKTTKEAAHEQSVLLASKTSISKKPDYKESKASPLFPEFCSISAKPTQQRTKLSLFMPSKRPGAAAANLKPVQKSALHKCKDMTERSKRKLR
mgnify:FL=1